MWSRIKFVSFCQDVLDVFNIFNENILTKTKITLSLSTYNIRFLQCINYCMFAINPYWYTNCSIRQSVFPLRQIHNVEKMHFPNPYLT